MDYYVQTIITDRVMRWPRPEAETIVHRYVEEVVHGFEEQSVPLGTIELVNMDRDESYLGYRLTFHGETPD